VESLAHINDTNQIAIVTGGERGLGKEIANRLIKNGIKVIVTSRSYEFNTSCKDFKKQMLIKQHLDVTNENSVIEFFAWIRSLKKQLIILVNNAGVGIFKPFTETTLNEWESMIQTNLTGAFLCAREVSKIMLKNGGGRIINIGSIVEKIPLTNNAAYGASKSGLKGLSNLLNEEYKRNKIRVTHVCLGASYTDIWCGREGFSKEDMLDATVVADCIAFIAFLPLSVRLDNIEIFPEKGVL